MATLNKNQIAKILHDIILYPVHAPVKFVSVRFKSVRKVPKQFIHVSFGMIIATSGVCMVKFLHTTNMPLHIAIDIIGYFFHGIGLAPLGKEVFKIVGYDDTLEPPLKKESEQVNKSEKIKVEEEQT